MKYFCCAVSEICLLDPLDCLLCEMKVESFAATETRLVVKMAAGFKEAMEKIAENPQQWKAKGTESEQVPDGPDEVFTAAKVRVASMFSRSMAGTKNIEDFFQRLPGAFKAAGFPVLDEEGAIDLGSGTVVQWDFVAMRAAEFFDVTFSAVSAKNFGKSVLCELAAVFPKDHTSVAKLKKLCAKIDEVSTPASLSLHMVQNRGFKTAGRLVGISSLIINRSPHI